MDILKSVASKANDVLKQTKLVSKGLAAAGYPMLSRAASAAGYGRRKGKGQAGGSIFGDILGKVASLPAGVIIGGTAGLHGAISGLGRKRRKRRARGRGMPITSENQKVLLM